MAHGHAHGAHATRRVLAGALILTVAFGAVQVVAGVAFGSLALIADAVHNLADGGAIALALLAAWAAARPPTATHTYGWARLEILAALVNGVLLIGLSAWIFYDAAIRLADPPAVDGGALVVVGLAGVVANGVAAWLLMRGDHDDLNLRGALLHAISDVAGSGGAAIAGVLVLAFGWYAADPAMAALIGLLVLLSSWNFVKRPLEILLEAVPAGVHSEQVGQAMASVPGVRDVHDLHIWTLTSRMTALSAHVVALPAADTDEVLHAVEATLRERFGIGHTTIQVERDHRQLLSIHRAGCPEGPQPLAAPLDEAPQVHVHRH